MKKLIVALLLIPSISHAGRITMNFGSGGGTVTFSSGTASSGGGSAPTFVRVSSMTYRGGGGSNCETGTITIGSGNTLVCFCGSGDTNGTTSMSDTLGNTYTAYAAQTLAGSNSSIKAFVAKNTTGGTGVISCTDHVNWPGGMDGFCAEYSGANLTAPVDVYSSSASAVTSGGLTMNSSPATTTASNVVMVSALRQGTGLTITGQSGTSRMTNTASYVQQIQDTVVTSPGSYESTYTWAGGSYFPSMYQVGIKP